MTDALKEIDILKKFKVEHFSELKKENIIELTSLLDQLDPQVAVKIVDQFPEFTQLSREVITDYKSLVHDILNKNDTNQKLILKACEQKLSTLEQLLHQKDLTSEDIKYYLSEMTATIEQMNSLDDKNKKWLGKLLTTVGTVMVSMAGLGIFLLGNGLRKK